MKSEGGYARGSLLRFRDADLELAYLQTEYRRNRRLVAAGCSIIVAMIASFYWLDPTLAPAPIIASLTAARSFVALPAAVLLVVVASLTADVRIWIPCCAALVTLFTAQVSALLLWNGALAFQYLSYSIWQGMIATFVLTGLPLRWSIGTSLVACLGFALCALRVDVSAADFANYFAVDVVIVFALSAFATYRYERASRSQFVAQRMSVAAHASQLALEADRRRWLEVIAAFLRHELKNAMTGVSSSIDLATRVGGAAAAAKYLDRAQRSVQYMHRLLAQVADATSLESALKQEAVERFDLSQLLAERVDDFRHDHGGRRFDTHIEPGIVVAGSPDAMLQLLDKLLNNALEHGDPAWPIGVALHGRAGDCSIVVSDRGDAIGGDTEEIFQPFVTRKGSRRGGDSLGLGLFVARTIAVHHGGAVRAEPLDEGRGARFTVDLPRCAG